MTMRTVLDVLPVMHEMTKLERALAELYRACGERFAEDQEFWTAIEQQEEIHAQVIERLAEVISAHPDQFRVGRQFKATAVRTIMSGIANYTEQVQRGQLPKQRAVFVARDIENSLLEASYSSIVSTDNVEFRQAMDLIAKDTLAHRNLFAAAAAKAGA
jgi:hypothetical protein